MKSGMRAKDDFKQKIQFRESPLNLVKISRKARQCKMFCYAYKFTAKNSAKLIAFCNYLSMMVDWLGPNRKNLRFFQFKGRTKNKIFRRSQKRRSVFVPFLIFPFIELAFFSHVLILELSLLFFLSCTKTSGFRRRQKCCAFLCD